MNTNQLLRFITLLCELEAVPGSEHAVWACGPHRFTAPLNRDTGNSQRLWACDGMLLQRMDWHELTRVSRFVSEHT